MDNKTPWEDVKYGCKGSYSTKCDAHNKYTNRNGCPVAIRMKEEETMPALRRAREDKERAKKEKAVARKMDKEAETAYQERRAAEMEKKRTAEKMIQYGYADDDTIVYEDDALKTMEEKFAKAREEDIARMAHLEEMLKTITNALVAQKPQPQEPPVPATPPKIYTQKEEKVIRKLNTEPEKLTDKQREVVAYFVHKKYGKSISPTSILPDGVNDLIRTFPLLRLNPQSPISTSESLDAHDQTIKEAEQELNLV